MPDKKSSRSNSASAFSYIEPQIRQRLKQDIRKWRTALNLAERIPDPRRYQLIYLYEELVLDAHLTAMWQRRKRSTLSKRYMVYDAAGQQDADLAALLHAPWFETVMSLRLDAEAYGHSLMQISKVKPLENGQGGIHHVELVPREHIEPVHGQILKRPYDVDGVNYRYNQQFQPWIIESHHDGAHLGFLNEAAPLVLYKRFAMAAWSKYAELFGAPMRVGKTRTSDDTMKRQMENMMQQMGYAAWAVLDVDDIFELHQPQTGKGEVFQELIRTANAELAKLVVGSVVGDDTSGGSRSKEEVGERIAQGIVAQDQEMLESWINNAVFPVLIMHGYPLEGCQFAFEDQPDLQALWRQTHEALQYYDVAPEWIEETFSIPVEPKARPNERPNQGGTDTE